MVVIIPNFPPNVDGLGDYAYLLVNQLRTDGASLKIDFVVAGNLSYPNKEYDGYKVYTLKKKTPVALIRVLKQLDTAIIHLHYVSYGYAKRGTPLWLLRGLQKWKSSNNNHVLITTFHESYATSIRPWTSSFWNQWLQKLICKKIFLLSEHSITNREANQNRFKKFSLSKKIAVLPVFSNMGEGSSIIPLFERKKQLVILGSIDSRNTIYKNYITEINKVCKKLNIQKVIDIGSVVAQLPKLDIPIEVMGIKGRNEISSILSESYAGLMGAYGSEYFARSGIFAAFTSHSMLVIALDADVRKPKDSIIANQHFITADSSNADYDAVSNAGYEWYMQHSLQKQAQVYYEIFKIYL